MRENISLRKEKDKLEKTLVERDQEHQKKVVGTMEEMREIDRKLKKKCKKLTKEKKEMTAILKKVQDENLRNKDYYA
jgi:hypothetical protein